MDPVRNPYAPGAGTPPPELAGRDELRETVRIAIARSLVEMHSGTMDIQSEVGEGTVVTVHLPREPQARIA